MSRFLILTILNLSLPFVLRAIYIYSLRLMAKRKAKKGIKDITPPKYHFPVFKLLAIGLILLALSLAFYRILGVAIDTSFQGNIARTEKF